MYTQFAHFNEPYTWLLFLTTTVTWMMAAIVGRRKNKPGAVPLSLMLLAMGLWSLGASLEFMAVSLEAKDFWVKWAWTGVVFVGPFLLLAALYQTAHEKILKSAWLPLLWVMPVVTVVIIFTNSWHHLMWRSLNWAAANSNAVVYDFGGWFWVHILFTNGIIITAAILFTHTLLRRRGVYRWQSLGALLALSFPWIANFLYLSGLGPGVDFTPVSFGLTGLVITLVFMRFRLLDLTPIAREKVIENMSEGMLTLDPQDQVVDFNPAALHLLGLDSVSPLGKAIAEIASNWPDLLAQYQRLDGSQGKFIVRGHTPPRHLSVRVTPLMDRAELVGRSLMLHDITDLKQTEISLQQKTDETVKLAEEISLLFEKEQAQRRMAESLRQTAMTLNSSLDYQNVVRRILTLMRNVIYYDSAGLFLQTNGELVLTDGVELDPSTFGYRIALNSPNRTAQVFNQQEPDIINDVRADPNWEPLPPFGYRIRSWLAAPMLIGAQAIGVVTVDSYIINAYGKTEVQVLQAFANQAAMAVQNARLHQQAQTAAALEERNRLAQDLHDAVNQTLFSASLIAEAVPEVWEKNPEQGRQGLEEVRLLTQSALAEMRTLLLELRPAGLTTKTLGELLTHLTTTVSSRSRTPVELVIDSDTRLPDNVQIVFYRIAQEAFNNIEKHAGASQINVRLKAVSRAAELIIIDNGRGFTPGQLPPGHLGLGIMEERAQSVGATLTMTSRPSNGTQVKLVWQDEEEAD